MFTLSAPSCTNEGRCDEEGSQRTHRLRPRNRGGWAVTVYRVTDEDGENALEISADTAEEAAEEYACLTMDPEQETNVVVDGRTYHVVVEWNPVYYAMEVKL